MAVGSEGSLAAAAEGPRRPHPVRLDVSDELGRARLVVLFRLLLTLPHLVWLALWSAAVVAVVVVAWVRAVATGEAPAGRLARFLAAYVRYRVHVLAFLSVVGRRFPGFTGAEGYGLDVVLEPAERLSRWNVALRLPLALPALVLDAFLDLGFAILALAAWGCGLVLGRVPARLRDLGARRLLYGARVYAYLLLLTDRYPSLRA